VYRARWMRRMRRSSQRERKSYTNTVVLELKCRWQARPIGTKCRESVLLRVSCCHMRSKQCDDKSGDQQAKLV